MINYQDKCHVCGKFTSIKSGGELHREIDCFGSPIHDIMTCRECTFTGREEGVNNEFKEDHDYNEWRQENRELEVY